MDLYLPFWVQCAVPGCGKWRKLPASIDLRHVRQDIVKCLNCDQPEDEVCVGVVCMGGCGVCGVYGWVWDVWCVFEVICACMTTVLLCVQGTCKYTS